MIKYYALQSGEPGIWGNLLRLVETDTGADVEMLTVKGGWESYSAGIRYIMWDSRDQAKEIPEKEAAKIRGDVLDFWVKSKVPGAILAKDAGPMDTSLPVWKD